MDVGFSGRLDSINLFEILQALEFNGKTGTLQVFETGHADGRLIVNEGTPVYAAIGDLTGERAVLSLLSHQEGSLRTKRARELGWEAKAGARNLTTTVSPSSSRTAR